MDQRESLGDIYGGSGNALNAVFQQHDFGHHVYSSGSCHPWFLGLMPVHVIKSYGNDSA